MATLGTTLHPVFGWSMVGIILAVLGRLWMALLTCFSGPEPPSTLPVSVRPPENSAEGSSRGMGRKHGEGFVNTGILI